MIEQFKREDSDQLFCRFLRVVKIKFKIRGVHIHWRLGKNSVQHFARIKPCSKKVICLCALLSVNVTSGGGDLITNENYLGTNFILFSDVQRVSIYI